MPRYNSKYARRRRIQRRRRNRRIYRRTSARRQARQLVKVNKRIDRIKNKIAEARAVQGLYYNYSETIVAPCNVIPIQPQVNTSTQIPQSWTQFGDENTTLLSASRVRLGKMHISLMITSGSEAQPIRYTVMHVKLNPATAEQTVTRFGQDLNGIWNGSTLKSEIGIQGNVGLTGEASMQGFVSLNPSYFKVIKQWQFCIGVESYHTSAKTRTGGPLGIPSYKVINYSFPQGYNLGVNPTNVADSWTDAFQSRDVRPELRSWFFIFNDNTLDSEGSNTLKIFARTTVSGLGNAVQT